MECEPLRSGSVGLGLLQTLKPGSPGSWCLFFFNVLRGSSWSFLPGGRGTYLFPPSLSKPSPCLFLFLQPEQYFLRIFWLDEFGESCPDHFSLLHQEVLPLPRPKTPNCRAHDPSVSQGHRHPGAEAPSASSLPPLLFSCQSPSRGRLLLGYFYPRSFLKEKAVWSLSQSVGLRPYGKPPLMGKESGLFFLGVLAWSLHYPSLANLSGFQLLMCCF